MKRATEIAGSRHEFQANVAPAVYTRDARERLLPRLSSLPFPREIIKNPLSLADSSVVKKHLHIDFIDLLTVPRSDGVSGVEAKFNVFENGYGDRHFLGIFAGGVGNGINRQLLDQGLINKKLSLMDFGRMFQTGWFGQLGNQMALTGNGLLQSTLRVDSSGSRLLSAMNLNNDDGVPRVTNVYVVKKDPESGLSTVVLSHEAKAFLRERIDRALSVGCPVARTSFTATSEQAEFLEERGHLGDRSGFYREEDLTSSGLVRISQGVNTAIDDVLWQWGDYVNRYGAYLLATGADPEGISPTEADQVLLLR